jgi:hypothetical protein
MNARTMAGWVLVVWALFAGMFAVLCMLMPRAHQPQPHPEGDA